MEKTTYKAQGYVLGNYWGGGSGAYPTIQFEADSISELNNKIDEALKDGSIDSGMGYESLIGAMMDIEIIETITVNDKEYTRSEFDYGVAYGKLNEKEIDFLVECNMF